MGEDRTNETATTPVESDGSLSEDVRSRFGHLHDRFDERQREGSDSTTKQATTAPLSPADRPYWYFTSTISARSVQRRCAK